LSQKALTRRGFLIAAGAVVAASALRPRPTGAQTPPAPIPGKEKLSVRGPRPVNLETPLRELTAYHTPDDVFFVRNNYDTAPIDPAQWSVKIEGEADNPLVLRLLAPALPRPERPLTPQRHRAVVAGAVRPRETRVSGIASDPAVKRCSLTGATSRRFAWSNGAAPLPPRQREDAEDSASV